MLSRFQEVPVVFVYLIFFAYVAVIITVVTPIWRRRNIPRLDRFSDPVGVVLGFVLVFYMLPLIERYILSGLSGAHRGLVAGPTVGAGILLGVWVCRLVVRAVHFLLVKRDPRWWRRIWEKRTIPAHERLSRAVGVVLGLVLICCTMPLIRRYIPSGLSGAHRGIVVGSTTGVALFLGIWVGRLVVRAVHSLLVKRDAR